MLISELHEGIWDRIWNGPEDNFHLMFKLWFGQPKMMGQNMPKGFRGRK
jgi:hypothetical protein